MLDQEDAEVARNDPVLESALRKSGVNVACSSFCSRALILPKRASAALRWISNLALGIAWRLAVAMRCSASRCSRRSVSLSFCYAYEAIPGNVLVTRSPMTGRHLPSAPGLVVELASNSYSGLGDAGD